MKQGIAIGSAGEDGRSEAKSHENRSLGEDYRQPCEL